MGLRRLGISNPASNTNTTIFTADNQYLVSVIATNKSSSVPSNIRVWVQPFGSSSDSQYAYIVYDIPVDPSNSYETFRFAVNQNDVVRVRSTTADLSFQVYGLVQFDVNLGIGTSSYQTSEPSNAIAGMIWVDSDGTMVGGQKPAYVYDGTIWQPIIGGVDTSLNYTFTGNISLPSTTSIGNVSSTEIGYLDNVTSSIQTQLNAKSEKSAGYQYAQTLYYTSNGTFTKGSYPWLRGIKVRLVGGGGGGGGATSNNSGGSGGGGGGYAESFITDISGLSSSISVTVGSGGTAGTGNGVSGGTSSFGSLVVATGGAFGTATTSIGSLGGVGTSGQFLSRGGSSESVKNMFDDSISPSAGSGGGDSMLGGGGYGGVNFGTGTDGASGGNYGGGGGGAFRISTNQSGGPGAPGIVIVELYA